MDKTDVSRTTGNFTWNIDNDILTINGIGKIPDYSLNNPSPWRGKHYISVIIEHGITEIGNYTFNDSNLLTVVIPHSVTVIGCSSFRYCENLTSVIIGNSVNNIRNNAFLGCNKIKFLNIPKSVKSFENFVFFDCKELVEIVNHAVKPQSLGDRVFKGVDISTCVLRVPSISIENYKNTEVWKDFENIESIEIKDLMK